MDIIEKIIRGTCLVGNSNKLFISLISDLESSRIDQIYERVLRRKSIVIHRSEENRYSKKIDRKVLDEFWAKNKNFDTWLAFPIVSTDTMGEFLGVSHILSFGLKEFSSYIDDPELVSHFKNVLPLKIKQLDDTFAQRNISLPYKITPSYYQISFKRPRSKFLTLENADHIKRELETKIAVFVSQIKQIDENDLFYTYFCNVSSEATMHPFLLKFMIQCMTGDNHTKATRLETMETFDEFKVTFTRDELNCATESAIGKPDRESDIIGPSKLPNSS